MCECFSYFSHWINTYELNRTCCKGGKAVWPHYSDVPPWLRHPSFASFWCSKCSKCAEMSKDFFFLLPLWELLSLWSQYRSSLLLKKAFGGIWFSWSLHRPARIQCFLRRIQILKMLWRQPDHLRGEKKDMEGEEQEKSDVRQTHTLFSLDGSSLNIKIKVGTL